MSVPYTVPISVVIPAYNAAAHLRACVESVLGQTFRDVEVIVIDDGSTDATAEVITELAAADPRIVAHHQENKGLAATRNVGIALARGEYVVFVDADDVVSPDHLASLLAGVRDHDVDMAICATRQYFGEGDPRNRDYALPLGVHSADDVLLATLYYDIYSTAWGRIVKRSLYDGIAYEPDVLYEDVVPACRLLLKAGRIASVAGTYDYVMRPDSIQHQAFSRAQMDKVRQALTVHELVGSRTAAMDVAARHLLVSCCFNTLSKVPPGDQWDDVRGDLQGLIRQHRWTVIRDRRARLKARSACLLSYVSFRLLDRLYGSFKSI